MKRGFTLIELLIVVAIIGILAAVGAVVIPNVLENAKEKSAAQNCQSVTDWVKLNFTNCSLGSQHITYKTSSGEVNVSCQQTGKQHSKYWVTHFTESGFSNPFNSSWRFMQESTNHIPNPNGSINNIAGILNEKKNILGMMPHPERMIDNLTGGTDGTALFSSILN